jgi:ribonuclease HI
MGTLDQQSTMLSNLMAKHDHEHVKSKESIYCDGGTIGRNPSKEGGSWAWCLVKNDKVIKSDSGIILPKDIDLPSVTNNLAEFLAALYALENMEDGWKGIVYTDSSVTFCRLRRASARTNGIPKQFVDRLAKQRIRLKSIRVNLIAAHPSTVELSDGFKHRRGKKVQVSKHNVFCDKLCEQAVLSIKI